MKNKKALLVLLPLVALILEFLPNGVVLNFANPEGEPWRRTYSYFSLTPFGYANFGPLIAAILTCVLLVLVAIYLFKPRKGLNTAILNVSGFATAASLMPLMFGFDYITVTGVIITALMAGTFGCGFIKTK
ncbi:MAG: hypothetical protein IJC05_00070 [Phascolarctobacterium sp.]|nr:hypothetical protein [Phascolarctobacterium sp.]